MSTRPYFLTYLALLALLLLSWAASYLNLGAANTILSLAIAATKAALIGLIFMKLKQSSNLVRFFSAVGLFWLGILFTLTLSDYLSRNWMALPSLWPQAPQSIEVSRPEIRSVR